MAAANEGEAGKVPEERREEVESWIGSGQFHLPEGFRDADTQAIVKRAQEGDVQALNDLFARYHSLMVEIARRRLGPRLAL
jgi:hypothetical protein